MRKLFMMAMVVGVLSGCQPYTYGDIHSMTEQCDKSGGRLVITSKDNHNRPTRALCEIDGFRYSFRFSGNGNGYILD